ncbi:MAG: class I SAM-dependent methyltransferase [Gemmatimonadaceae bacterium]|nr:class I SAM-dependent methyltransferase [Gemmatimonadaceae bacterium]
MTEPGIACRVCGADASYFATARVLRRYDVRYYRCVVCRAVQTEQPYWLDEAYTTALTAADVGAVQRKIQLAEQAAAIIETHADPAGAFLDYGGGHGLFVRLMRDKGFNFRWTDHYAANNYAIGFDAPEGQGGFSLITAFEVAEHLVTPRDTIRALMGRGDALLFSTELLPEPVPKPDEWWYYVLAGGQHITLYAKSTLAVIAAQLGLRWTTNGRNLHLLTRGPVRPKVFRLLSKYRVARLFNVVRRRRSLQPTDFEGFTRA